MILLREDVYGDGRFWKKSLVSGRLLVFDLIHMQEVCLKGQKQRTNWN